MIIWWPFIDSLGMAESRIDPVEEVCTMDTCPKNRESFVDFDKCMRLIDDIETKLDPIAHDEFKSHDEAEKLIESFKKSIDPYQEQPELLDPYLPELIAKLTSGLSDFTISKYRYHTTFKFLYQLIKVNGFKSIGKKFPHETDKLPLLVELLSKEDTKDKINWHTRYVLTVWLSIVILTPFDLAKFDPISSDQGIAEKLYSILMLSLVSHDSCQQVSAFCLAKYFSRPDVLKSNNHVDEFVQSTLCELAKIKLGSASSVDDVPLIGHLRTLIYMFKFLPREETKRRSKTVLDCVTKLDIEEINRELVNHLIIKLIQRAGLVMLPTRIATWRYKRASRVLGRIGETNSSQSTGISNEPTLLDNNDEVSASEHLESIFSILFVAAQNAQTKIRWSAAKGIARLASRLSRERAGEVIDVVIANSFATTSNEFAWHGGSLTLAEMSRNGLILEEKLPDVISIIGDAIIYDKIKGSFAVGAHVREAACYVCWAMARTYEDNLLRPHISSISINLLCTMLFDREQQCRRAASATFQELIGRQGTFDEEDINILTNLDHQNVGQRQLTYMNLAPRVASYGRKYSRPFVQHLISKKIGHWDVQIRRLSSDSLSALMLHSDHDFVQTEVLAKLMEMVDQDADNNVKHGALLALAKVTRGLVPLQFSFDQAFIEFTGDIVKKCAKQLKSKQQAPNFIEAIGLMITSAEVAGFSYSESVISQWESIALTALDSDVPSLRDIGSDALLTLYRSFYGENKSQQDKLLAILNKSLISYNESSRCGGLRALSKLSQALSPTKSQNGVRNDADTPDIVLISLTSYISKTTRESADIVFAQAKAEACTALVEFICQLDESQIIVSSSLIKAGYDALLERSEDYTFDKRGDIGVVVRRAAIKAIQNLTLYLVSLGLTSLLDSNRVTRIMAKTIQQAISYNNSAREQAATAFHQLVGSALPEDTIPHKAEILQLFERFGVSDEFNWRDDSTPIFVNLLDKPEYSMDLWIGLLPSVGQISDMCARQFRKALSEYLLSLADAPERFEFVLDAFLSVLERNDMADRLLTSGLIVADYLLTEGLLNDTSSKFQARLAKICWNCRKSNDPKRIASVARVLCSMLQFTGHVQVECLQYCLALLANGYAKVRVCTAEQLYQSIMTYQPDIEENLTLTQVGDDQSESDPKGHIKSDFSKESCIDLIGALDLLSQTNWSEPLEKVKPIRDKIATYLSMEPSSLHKLASGGAVVKSNQVLA